MPKYNFKNIPDKFKLHIRNRFALLNSIDCEPEELWFETRDIIREEYKGTIYLVKREEKCIWMMGENS